MHKPRTLEYPRPVTSHLDVINKRDQSTHTQGNIDSYKQTQGINNPYKKKLEKINS